MEFFSQVKDCGVDLDRVNAFRPVSKCPRRIIAGAGPHDQDSATTLREAERCVVGALNMIVPSYFGVPS